MTSSCSYLWDQFKHNLKFVNILELTMDNEESETCLPNSNVVLLCWNLNKRIVNCRSEETETPSVVVPHNGVQTENKEAKGDSEKLNITCSSIVTKVQNGGVARHGTGRCNWTNIKGQILLSCSHTFLIKVVWRSYGMSRKFALGDHSLILMTSEVE